MKLANIGSRTYVANQLVTKFSITEIISGADENEDDKSGADSLAKENNLKYTGYSPNWKLIKEVQV